MRRPSDFVNEKAKRYRNLGRSMASDLDNFAGANYSTWNPRSNQVQTVSRSTLRYDSTLRDLPEKSPENPRRTRSDYSLDLNQMVIRWMDCDPLSKGSNDD
jgi:hypothetical protein